MQEKFILIGTNYVINMHIIIFNINKSMIQKINKYREKCGIKQI